MKTGRYLAALKNKWVCLILGLGIAACASTGSNEGSGSAGVTTGAGGSGGALATGGTQTSNGGSGGEAAVGGSAQGGNSQGGMSQGGNTNQGGTGGMSQGGTGGAPGSCAEGGQGGTTLFCGDSLLCGAELCDDGNNTSCDLLTPGDPQVGPYGCRDDCSGSGPIGLSVVAAGDDPNDSSKAILEVVMDSCVEVAGFQFDIIGLDISSTSGGSAGVANFSVANNTYRVVAFPPLVTPLPTIPAGDGVLLNISYLKSSHATNTPVCVTNPVFTDSTAMLNYAVDVHTTYACVNF